MRISQKYFAISESSDVFNRLLVNLKEANFYKLNENYNRTSLGERDTVKKIIECLYARREAKKKYILIFIFIRDSFRIESTWYKVWAEEVQSTMIWKCDLREVEINLD